MRTSSLIPSLQKIFACVGAFALIAAISGADEPLTPSGRIPPPSPLLARDECAPRSWAERLLNPSPDKNQCEVYWPATPQYPPLSRPASPEFSSRQSSIERSPTSSSL